MATHRPAQLSDHAPPPFRPHTPDPEHESTVSNHSPTTRVQNAIKQILFGNAKVNKHAANQRAQQLQQEEEMHRARVLAQSENASVDKRRDGSEKRNPSIEAREENVVNKNGFGDGGDGDNEQWGWPGLGTWQGYSAGDGQGKR